MRWTAILLAATAHAARTIVDQRKYAEDRVMRLLYDAHGPVKIVSRIKEKLGPTRGCKTTKLVTLVSFGEANNLGVLKIMSRSTAMVRLSRRCSVTREIDAHRAIAAAAPGLVPRVINSFVDVDIVENGITSGALFTEYLSPDEYVLYETLDPLTPRHLLLAAQAVERFHAVGYRNERCGNQRRLCEGILNPTRAQVTATCTSKTFCGASRRKA